MVRIQGIFCRKVEGGELMAQQSVEKIRQAEKTAIENEKLADKQANDLIQNAEIQARDLIDNLKKSRKPVFDSKVEEAKKQAQEIIEQAKDLVAKESLDMRNKAVLKQKELDKAVLEIILS